MKKFIISLLFVSVSLFVFSQNNDYSFIRTDGAYHYAKSVNGDSYNGMISQDFSKIIETDSGKYCFGFPYAYEHHQSDEYEHIDAHTGSMGDSIFIDNAGNTTIYTARGKTFIFKNYREQKGSWIIYTDENGNYLKGYYPDFSYTSFAPYLPDVIDSAATLRIRAYDTSNHVIESYLSTDILVSKNYGVNKIFEFNDIEDIDKYYFILYNVGIEKADFNSGFSRKDEYESVLLSLEIGSETHIKYEDFNSEEYHYQIRKVIAKDIGDSLVNYTFQYCDSIPNEDTIIQSVVTKSYNYRLRDRELHWVEIFGGKEKFIDITKFFITDWHGKKHFKFYIRLTDLMWENNSRDYWVFTDPDVMGNHGTKYYEFIEGVGEILVDAWGGNYLLDEIHYFKTSTDEWGTPFTHSCSNSSGLSETQIAQIVIYPNPTENNLYIQSPFIIEQVLIYDTQGRLVKYDEGTKQMILNVSDLERGLYIIQFNTKGGLIGQRKFQKL